MASFRTGSLVAEDTGTAKGDPADPAQGEGHEGPSGEGHEGPPGDGQRPGRLGRLLRWHAGLSWSNRLALYTLVCTAVLGIAPLAATVWRAVFDHSPVAILVETRTDPCSTRWLVPPGGEHLLSALPFADTRQYSRWERQGELVHAETVAASVSLRGTIDGAVEIRDISISVDRRDPPVQGTQPEGIGCGGPDEGPEYLVVDLDTLPLGREVSASYLQQSEQQSNARETGEVLGGPLRIPRQVTSDDIYSFEIIGRSQRYDCDWHATVTWWDGEEVRQDTIDNDGRPFRVSAAG